MSIVGDLMRARLLSEPFETFLVTAIVIDEREYFLTYNKGNRSIKICY